MNINRNRIIASVATLGLLAGTASVFAATPTFTVAAPMSGEPVGDFVDQLDVYNVQDIADLLAAKTVTVYNINTAWSGDDTGTALNAVDNGVSSIDALHAALSRNKPAIELLADHNILNKNVVDIVSDGRGAVQIYVR